MKQLFVLIVFATLVFFVNASELAVGTNTFYYVFEDTELSPVMENRILSELEIMQRPWIDRESVFYSWSITDPSEANGFVRFNNISTQPFLYQIRLNELDFKTNINGRLEILLSKERTDIFTNAFVFINNHIEAWNEVTNFYAAFTENALTNLPVGGVKQIRYIPNATDLQLAEKHTELITDLLSYNYNMPNVLGIAELPAGFLDYPEQALWLALPVTDKEGEGRLNTKWHDVYYCVWRNGHWYLWKHRWADM